MKKQRDPVKIVLWTIIALTLIWGLFFVKAGIFSGPLIVLNGIRFGAILMLGAIGLTLTYKILNFANFAHGDLMMFGAFVAFSFDWMLVDILPQVIPALGDPAQADALRWIAIVIAMIFGVAFTIALALFIDRVLYRKMRRSAAVVLVIASFGMALFIRAFIQAIWGVGNRAYAMLIKPPMVFFHDTPFRITITPVQIVTIVSAIALIILVHLFLKYTKTGKGMRAMSDNMDLAKVTGINTERMIQWTWVLGAGLAAISGVFFGLNLGTITPNSGQLILLSLFAAVILGGVGSPYGAMVGGLLIGIAQNILLAPVKLIDISAFKFTIPLTDITLFDLSNLTIHWAIGAWTIIDINPETFVRLNAQYKPAIAFLLMILMLLIRPQGLLGKPERRG